VVGPLKAHGYECLFGDISDPEIMEQAGFDRAKLVISTSPDLKDNLGLLEEMNLLDSRPKVILRAETEPEAAILYGKGADYVLLPYFTAGQYLGKTIAVDPTVAILDSLKKRDLAMLQRNHGFQPG
jgi:voltage-gated potassium channel Kch